MKFIKKIVLNKFMKIFIIKSLFIFVCLFVLFRVTVSSLINTYEEKFTYYFSKENVSFMKDKIRKEMQIAINKDQYLDPEDATLIKKFITKINNELN